MHKSTYDKNRLFRLHAFEILIFVILAILIGLCLTVTSLISNKMIII